MHESPYSHKKDGFGPLLFTNSTRVRSILFASSPRPTLVFMTLYSPSGTRLSVSKEKSIALVCSLYSTFRSVIFIRPGDAALNAKVIKSSPTPLRVSSVFNAPTKFGTLETSVPTTDESLAIMVEPFKKTTDCQSQDPTSLILIAGRSG